MSALLDKTLSKLAAYDEGSMMGSLLSFAVSQTKPQQDHVLCTEAESKDYNTFTAGNPTPESTLTLCQSRLYPTVRDFGFDLCKRTDRVTERKD
jgi:hypothetical protein